jgi:hypothetical protein
MSRPFAATLAAVTLLWLVPAAASTKLPADFRVTVTDATVIVRGRVTDVRAVRSVRGEVETVATITVAAVLKGESAAHVSLRIPGGTIGRVRTVMPGAPRVSLGDEGVYLLKRVPGGALWPVGLSSGIYRVTSVAGRPMVRSMPLSEFESLVRLVVRTPSGGAR